LSLLLVELSIKQSLIIDMLMLVLIPAAVDAGKAGPLYEYERRISSGELVDGDSFQV